MHLRHLAPAAVLALLPAFAACSDDDPDSTSAETSSAAPTSDTAEPTTATPSPSATSATPTETAPASTLPAACDVVTVDDLSRVYGQSFVLDGADTGETTEGGLSWRTNSCDFDVEGLVDVEVSLTGPGDFTKGSFGCPQPSDADGIVEPVDDIAGATGGWWKVSSAPPLEGELRACSADALVTVEIDYEDGQDYEGDPRSESVQLAEMVLRNLQG
ncbi:hypothetical protein JK386_08690 [Nocardioides sp. zg-536]|uniref:DUF3558 domain-containing protein n=1 Tax=Nocardioides faecalis TaxID=2803858 RepID=A0A938Y9Z2_9ACTN|nr:hypothetical protein [Nocardioides faecalis]MBM9459979.1 hypothetical protein [Nocardioides faecalis]MBS4753151.1 hypothetical protein [Nocardioides faecalis]QVI58798.1 hypothetical protein KG111_17905 [Nocardioides faecalis]